MDFRAKELHMMNLHKLHENVIPSTYNNHTITLLCTIWTTEWLFFTILPLCYLNFSQSVKVNGLKWKCCGL